MYALVLKGTILCKFETHDLAVIAKLKKYNNNVKIKIVNL